MKRQHLSSPYLNETRPKYTEFVYYFWVDRIMLIFGCAPASYSQLSLHVKFITDNFTPVSVSISCFLYAANKICVNEQRKWRTKN